MDSEDRVQLKGVQNYNFLLAFSLLALVIIDAFLKGDFHHVFIHYLIYIGVTVNYFQLEKIFKKQEGIPLNKYTLKEKLLRLLSILSLGLIIYLTFTK